MNTVVWVIVSIVHAGIAFGPEFSSQQKCETAAKTVQQTMSTVNRLWGQNTPICVRIEK